MLSQFPNLKKRIVGVSHVIAVASGKGGVGKTTVAVNLALALQKNGARVGLYDADLYGPNVPLMLGVRRKSSAASDDPAGMIPVARVNAKPYIPPLERFGLRVMSIGLIMGGDAAVTPDPRMAGAIIRQTLEDVQWGELDILVVDLPPGTGEPQQSLLSSIQFDGVVIVTTPQDLSLMDAGRSLQFYRQAGAPILGVIENMSYLHCPHCDEPIEVFHRGDRPSLLDDADIALLGRVPLNIAISRGIDAGHPLVQEAPDAEEAHVFRTIATNVYSQLHEADDGRPG